VGWGPGPAKGEFPKHAFVVTSPPEIPSPKTKNLLFDFDYKTAESVDGLDSSLAQSPGEL